MAYQNNNGRNNNNKRRFNNKNRRNNNNGRRFGFDEDNISPQQRRQFTNKYETHMQKAKDIQRNDRVEAENQFQHAEHYYRMSQLGLDKEKEKAAAEAAEAAKNAENKEAATEESKEEKSEEKKAPKRKPRKSLPKDDKPADEKVSEEKPEAKDDSIAELPFLKS